MFKNIFPKEVERNIYYSPSGLEHMTSHANKREQDIRSALGEMEAHGYDISMQVIDLVAKKSRADQPFYKRVFLFEKYMTELVSKRKLLEHAFRFLSEKDRHLIERLLSQKIVTFAQFEKVEKQVAALMRKNQYLKKLDQPKQYTFSSPLIPGLSKIEAITSKELEKLHRMSPEKAFKWLELHLERLDTLYRDVVDGVISDQKTYLAIRNNPNPATAIVQLEKLEKLWDLKHNIARKRPRSHG